MTSRHRIALSLTLGLPGLLAAPPLAAAAVPTLVVGDSLAVGMRPYLDQLVPGRKLTWNVRSGRTTPQGLQILRGRLRESQPAAIVISLGTNDGPDPARFADRIRRMLAVTPPTTCVVWPNIVRPRRKGDEAGLNRVLRRVAARDPRLVVVDWERAVRTGRVVLPDALHPDAAGYARRSRMVAAALREGCDAGKGADAGTGQDPDTSGDPGTSANPGTPEDSGSGGVVAP